MWLFGAGGPLLTSESMQERKCRGRGRIEGGGRRERDGSWRYRFVTTKCVSLAAVAIFALIEFGFNRQSALPLPRPFVLSFILCDISSLQRSRARFGMRRSYADEAERGQRAAEAIHLNRKGDSDRTKPFRYRRSSKDRMGKRLVVLLRGAQAV